jgi:hypothetical protein
MPTPTSSWGQPNWSDVYTALPLGSGLQLGQGELLYDGSIVEFFQFLASTAAGNACTPSGSSALYTVTPTTAALQLVQVINDRSGAGLYGTNSTIAANSYAWGTVRGNCFPLLLNATAAGKFVISTVTTGQLKAYTVGTDIQANIYNTVLVGGSPAQSPCVMV